MAKEPDWILPDWVADKIEAAQAKLPLWAPAEAKAAWNAECRKALCVPAGRADDVVTILELDELDPTQYGLMGLYYRLMSYPDMKTAWASLRRREVDLKSFLSFSAMAYLGAEVLPLTGKTPKQEAAWVREVQTTARKLAVLVEGSRLDDYLMRRWMRQNLTAVAVSVAPNWTGEPTISDEHRRAIAECYKPEKSLAVMLRALARDASNFSLLGAASLPVAMDTVSDKNAPLRYFAKTMTRDLVRCCGLPLRDVVKPLTMRPRPRYQAIFTNLVSWEDVTVLVCWNLPFGIFAIIKGLAFNGGYARRPADGLLLRAGQGAT